MRSPFRYPGAKSRLLKTFRPLLDAMIQGKEAFHEPFVGGGSVGLYVASEYPLLPLYFNDLDPWMSAFWAVLADGTDSDIAELLSLVRRRPTIDLFTELRGREPDGVVEQAYYAVFFNRTTFSGILDAGPIGGLQQKSKWSVDCRYNVEQLTTSIRSLTQLLRGRLTADRGNAIDYIREYCSAGTLLYVDPPYVEKGNELYPVSMTPEEHEELASVLRETKASWILSYDYCETVQRLYDGLPSAVIGARYSVTGQDRANWVGKKEFLCWNDPSFELGTVDA